MIFFVYQAFSSSCFRFSLVPPLHLLPPLPCLFPSLLQKISESICNIFCLSSYFIVLFSNFIFIIFTLIRVLFHQLGDCIVAQLSYFFQL